MAVIHETGTFRIFMDMDIDFQEQYKNMSTNDLLKITIRPKSYQPAAILAATEILKNRGVTQSDRDLAEKEFIASEKASQNKKTFVTSIKGIEPMPGKWANVILAIAILEYLHLLYNDISSLNSVLHNANLRFRSVFLGSYIDLIYLPIVLFMFYKRKQWGWILLLVSKLFTIVPTLTFYFLDYSGGNSFPPFLFGIFLNITVAALMWKKEVRSILNVSNKTATLAVFGTALLLLIWILMFRYNR